MMQPLGVAGVGDLQAAAVGDGQGLDRLEDALGHGGVAELHAGDHQRRVVLEAEGREHNEGDVEVVGAVDDQDAAAEAQRAGVLDDGGNDRRVGPVADLDREADAVGPGVGGQAVDHKLAGEGRALGLEGGSGVAGGLGVRSHGDDRKRGASPGNVALHHVVAHRVPRHNGRGQLRVAQGGHAGGRSHHEEQGGGDAHHAAGSHPHTGLAVDARCGSDHWGVRFVVVCWLVKKTRGGGPFSLG